MVIAEDYVQKESGREPRFVDSRFANDGSVLPFSGLTFISMVTVSSGVSTWLREMTTSLRALPESDAFAWLPPSSFHMTLFDGVCDQDRSTDLWPRDVALGAPIAHLADLFLDRTRGSTAPIMKDLTFIGLVSGHDGGGLVLSVTPTAESNLVLRKFRDHLSEALLLRAPNHESYRFHVTLAYLTRWMSDDEAARFKVNAEELFLKMARNIELFDLEPARLCSFEDITRFVPVVQKFDSQSLLTG